MEASNLNRREFLTGLAALTLVGAAASSPVEAATPAEVAEIDTAIDTSQWEGVVSDDSDADKIAYLKKVISIFEKMIAEMRATIAKIEAGAL